MNNILKWLSSKNDDKLKGNMVILEAEDVSKICQWFEKWSKKDPQVASDLLEWIYIHTEIDLYPVDLYQKNIEVISSEYGISQSDFLECFTEAKKLIFE